jgi:signal transduction histidine kinase
MGVLPQRISYYYLTPEPGRTPTELREGGLLRVALAVNEGLSPREVVEQIFTTVGERLPCDRIGVALLEGDGWLVSKVVVSRFPIILGEGARGRLKGSSLGPIIRRQQIRVINDLEAYARDHPRSETTAKLVAEGMRSSLTLPLIAKRQAIGVMFFTSIQRGAYGGEHIAFLRTLATTVAIALERATMTEALRVALDSLKTLDQLKTNFLSNLSHELRTPLSIVLSYLQTLDDEVVGALSRPQHELLAEAIHAADRLNALLNDLFDFTELVAGSLHLQCLEFDLLGLLREVTEDARPAVTAAGLALSVELPTEPLPVMGDPPRLARAIQALIANAVKFTPPPGQVTVCAGRDPGGLWLDVKDTGIGIPLAQQRRIFEKFYQIEGGTDRAYGGAGLGLALCRAIVEAHGGYVSVHSTPGKGSTFRITLPNPPGGCK